MPGEAQGADLSMDHDTRYRYRCNQCQRLFTVAYGVAHRCEVRCPACLGDDVALWLNRRERLLGFLMLYEAACGRVTGTS
jgi:hypothetical protein